MSVIKDIASATAQVEVQAKPCDIEQKQRIEMENYEETLHIQSEEGQYAQQMHTRIANMGAYQVEKQTEVGVASAETLVKWELMVWALIPQHARLIEKTIGRVF